MEWSIAEVVSSFNHGVIHVGNGMYDAGGSSYFAAERTSARTFSQAPRRLYAVVR